MGIHADQSNEQHSQSPELEGSDIKTGSLGFSAIDSRPETAAQRKMQEAADNSPQVKQLKQLQAAASNSVQAKEATQLKSIANKGAASPQAPIQAKKANEGPVQPIGSGLQRKTAKAGLNNQKSIAGPGVLQAKKGDLSTGVLPRFRSRPDERRTVLEALPAVPARDGDENNARKVQFENALANWVQVNSVAFMESAFQLSACIGDYLATRQEHIGIEVAASMASLTPEASTYGRMAAEAAAYPEHLRNLTLGTGGSLHEHLLFHQMFIDKIYNQDADRIVGELSEQFRLLIAEPMEADALKPKAGAVDIGIGSTSYETGHDKARIPPRRPQDVPKVQNGGLGPHDPEVHGVGAMERGTDRFTAAEDNAFVQAARLVLDMPISGTGLSGSATDMFACGKLFGVGDKPGYALAAFSFFASAGAHTFHEVMLMAKAAGFSDYVPGNYISAIPPAMRAKAREELAVFNDLLQDPGHEAAPAQAADKTLHGWKDELALAGEVDTWADQVKTFISRRFGVAEGAVQVAVIADGRSGDMVYKIDVDQGAEQGIFRGIFKVFNDADVADTEINIGEKMAASGVRTPANKGVVRVETESRSPSKAGVLFDRAEGDSVHELVQRIGALEKGSEARVPLIESLKAGVVGVARELAKLHGKTLAAGQGGRVLEPAPLNAAARMDQSVKNLHEKGLYEAHLLAASDKFAGEEEVDAVRGAFDALLQNNLVQQKVRKSMTHGDANGGNFIVSDSNASVIDVNTGVQSLGSRGGIKTGAADTGRFLETLFTSSPGALTPEELNELNALFHNHYMPGEEVFRREVSPAPSKKERAALERVENEKAADQLAEVYYRACWILNQLSHSEDARQQTILKRRLIELVPALHGRITTGEEA